MLQLVLALLVFAGACLAQVTTGTLTGTVTDSSGAVMANVKVRVTNAGTGLTWEASTNERGDYVFPNLAAAAYNVRAEAPGFKAAEARQVRLLLNATVRTDFRLEPGAVEQSIEVTAAPPVVNSETSSIASVVDTHTVVTLPLNGRTLDRLIQITAGNASDSVSNPKLGGSLHWGGNFFTMDGVNFNDTGNGGAAYSFRTALSTTPSVDTIQEFKIESNNAKAEHEGSAAISMISKSGTNQFHGSLFEFNRNRELAAKNFFATGLPKPAFNRNEFGATGGGRIIRNRTFFFGAYEGLRQRTANTPFLAMPTPAMRQGDFAGLPALRDPLSDTPFPSNRIPSNRLDPRATRLLEFVPQPNTPGSGVAGTGLNYVATVGNIIDVNRYSAKFDHSINAKNLVTIVANYSKGSPYFVALNSPANYGNFGDGGYITKSLSGSYNATISPTKINEFRYSYFSHGSIRIGQNTDFNPASIFPSLYQPLPIGGLPNVSIAGFAAIGDSGGSPRGIQPTQQITDNFTFIKGKHTFKSGVDIGFNRVATNPGAAGSAFGQFTFNGRYSNNSYGDFLLGFPVGTTRQTPFISSLLYNSRYGAYFQDDWKVSSRLTLNLGVRYMLQTITQERDGSFANFDFGRGAYVIRTEDQQLPRNAVPRLLEAYPFTGSEANGWGSNVMTSDRNNWAPRVGFAYRPFNDNKTVLRGGFGMFYNVIPVFIGIRQLSWQNTPFLLTETFEAAAGNAPSLTLANPFPGAGRLSPNPSITAVNRNLTNTVAQQWNLTVERELYGNYGLRASYIGNKATRVPWYVYNKNLPVRQVPGTIQANRPFQPWADINALDTNGNAITHQMQLEVTRRYTNGFFLQGSYSWTKTLDNVPIVGTPQNPYNAALDRGMGDSIRAHVVYFSSTYELPMGRGKRLLSSAGAANYLVGGWSLASIVQLRTGTPFSVGFTPTAAGWYANRADAINPQRYPIGVQDIEQWFNPAAFAVPQPFTFGSSARNTLTGPGQTIIDISVIKDTKIGERFTAQFRLEFFNFPNMPSFGNPAANISFPAQVGRIRSTSIDNRVVQLGLKVIF